ncbi:MAG TPA: VWA domain-containing protein [Candidatus Aquilonibacter sp.]|nr:VWA domain-containing protein [Candidatus Aquilonibacter sp.]
MKRPRRPVAAWPLLFCAVLLCAGFRTVLADAQQPAAQIAQPLQSSSDLAIVNLSVLDAKGNFYGGLSRDDFHVFDDGVEKPIVFFSPTDSPARVVILMETGPAVFLIHDQHLLALSSLLDGLAPDDEAALFAYAESVREVYPFTADKAALRTSIDESEFTLGMDRLNFYDSLGHVIDNLPPGPGKNVIVVLATGLDDSSESRWDLLERKLRADNVVVFTVGLGGQLRGDAPQKPAKKQKKKKNQAADVGPTPAFARADEALRSIAQITGGRAYFPQTPDDFGPAYREIAATVRHQYVLGIAPSHDGAFHRLTITVTGIASPQKSKHAAAPAYRLFYREGYLAPSP